MASSRLRSHGNDRSEKKRGGHPRRGAAVQFVASIHPDGWTLKRPSSGEAPSGRWSDGRGTRISLRDVVLEDVGEFGDEALATERAIESAIDEDRRDGLLERARETDADVGVLALAGAVDDTAHDGHPEVLDAGVRLAPLGHPILEIGLDLERHLVEEGRRRATAAGTRA